MRRVPQAVMTFDMGCPVGDVAWAPHSATAFAAAGEDGKVRINADNVPVCEQHNKGLNVRSSYVHVQNMRSFAQSWL